MKKTNREPLITTAIRLDKEKIRMAQKLNIDIPTLFRKSLDEAILKSGRCPVCRRKISSHETDL